LEARLQGIYSVMQRDSDIAEEEWRRGDWERTMQSALREPGTVVAYHDDEERPPSAQETAHLWKDLLDDCWYRDRLRSLLDDALFCVLPEAKHDGAVAFHSTTLTVEPIVDTLCQVIREQGGSSSVIAYIEG
jgi:hypothetical protein